MSAAERVDAVETLAEYCLETKYSDLPAGVVRAAKRQILDLVGVGLAGGAAPGARQLREFTVEMAGRPEVGIWGTGIRVPAQDAARVNATMAHSLDYDDDYEPAFVHPSVVTVPAAIAAAELAGGVSGAELVTSVALGIDLACRLALSGRPGMAAFTHGWHNTSLCGYFSSAFVAGRLLGLSRTELVSALGIVLQQAAGGSQAHLDGALTKRMGPGFASYAGVLAARLAARGVTGAHNVLEGRRGFFFQYHGLDYSRQLLLADLGTSFASPEVAIKPWPSCRGSHPAIDAALGLVAEAGVDASDIDRITVATGPAEYALLASPIEKKRRPRTIVEAQFSVPWVIAAALVDHRVALEHFRPAALERTDLLDVTRRIDTLEDAGLAREGGGTGATRVDVLLDDGRHMQKTVSLAKGAPENPMSDEDLTAKFFDCAQAAGLGSDQAHAVLTTISRLDTLGNTNDLAALLALEPVVAPASFSL